MCTISDKLKLCTCKTKRVDQLEHVWFLKRPNDKNICVFGEMMFPAEIGEKADELNQKTILTQLNNGNCFDVDFQPQTNDVLVLHFSLKQSLEKDPKKPSFNSDYLAYAFKFVNGKWKVDDYNPFDSNFEDIQFGKIINPFTGDY